VSSAIEAFIAVDREHGLGARIKRVSCWVLPWRSWRRPN